MPMADVNEAGERTIGERTIEIYRERCVRCSECIDVCPQSGEREYPVYVRGDDGYPQVANIDNCLGCLSCEDSCRAVALRVREAGSREKRSTGEARAEAKARAIF